MNDQTIKEIAAELAATLAGRIFGKVFQLSRASLAIDFRPSDGRYLFVAVEPGEPRLYMIARSVRELERESIAPLPFALVLRKALSGAVLRALTKDEGDRVVRFSFAARDEVGHDSRPVLVAQLTGRTANLFLLDSAGRIVDSLRPARGEGQEIGESYAAPRASAPAIAVAGTEAPFPREGFASVSEAADRFYRQLAAERAFDARAANIAARLRQELARRRKLLDNLERDLARHGDAEEHKRTGDLLLANLANAERRGNRVLLTDFYAEDAPLVELEIDEHKSLQEVAAEAFTRYTKAKRAAQEIARRMETVGGEMSVLEGRLAALDTIVARRDLAALESFGDEKQANRQRADKRAGGQARAAGEPQTGGANQASRAGAAGKVSENIPGVRRYRSSDGYEVLVGRGARDNDHLTFRVARAHDTWLHAADYPGSHVVVRNHKRGEDVPHRTIIEAAQLAARFSQARQDAKVAVNYTQRKFVSKIKGGAPGLVRLSSFRTLLVEPGENIERI